MALQDAVFSIKSNAINAIEKIIEDPVRATVFHWEEETLQEAEVNAIEHVLRIMNIQLKKARLKYNRKIAGKQNDRT